MNGVAQPKPLNWRELYQSNQTQTSRLCTETRETSRLPNEKGGEKNERTAPIWSRIKHTNWILGSASDTSKSSFTNSNSQPIHMLTQNEVYCSQSGQILKTQL